ncbi:hypothetical protein [Actinomycetospora sp. TBRC 11914]|uniref:hypothetical protein n=1 Tax=Actinomycetospora sp. TBRC 11914 TaxID=2729387 RepID=UPI00145D268F|nr:hypothetical protein [Actinomycetospora sp. TBRC 11914]NMO93036.1 hypothetical protein [Actinomycetospora sp. TBRC 11914]
MGRHRHITCVRADGLSTVLATLLEDRRVVAATLVDLGSGLVLDACSRDGDLTDLELLGAGHADLARAATAVSGSRPAFEATTTVETPDGRVHLLREVPDPHGDRLVLAVVVAGTSRSVARARQKMAAVPVEALTAGPTLQRRPVDGRWLIGPVAPEVPAVAPEGLPGLEPVHPTAGPPRPEGLAGLEPVVPKGPARPEGLPGLEPVVSKGPARPEGLPGLEPVVPKAHRVEPESTVADEPAPPPAMVPVVVTFAPDPARWAGETPEDRADEAVDDETADDAADAEIPAPREEPAGADV